jgi:hypothetical protein
MTLLNKITFFKKIPRVFYIYFIFIFLHVALFNINVAEWGDSYRILRASEFIREGAYPDDEKRPPLFSLILSVRPDSVDAVMWGRVVMFIFSLLSFYIFEKLTKIQIKNDKYRFLSLLLYIFNPVYLYWSIRIMADVPFSFFVLLVFYLISKWRALDYKKTALLGFLSGLAILTRFEGYLLLGSVFIAVIFHGKEINFKKFETKNVFLAILHSLPKVVTLGLTTLFTLLPWLLYRNPLSSEYFNEPSRRIYDFKMVWTYFTSLLFIFGFTTAFYFIFKKFRIVLEYFRKKVGIATFVLLELILILLWPAAIPRLFVPLVPFLVIILSLSMERFFEDSMGSDRKVVDFSIPLLFLAFYIFSQYFLKLQFLLPVKLFFAILVLLQLFSVFLLYVGKLRLWVGTIIFSSVFWSLSIVYIHKDIYTAIKSAAIYTRDNLEGKIVTNDTTSIMDWYINYSCPNGNTEALKINFQNEEYLSYNKLLDKEMSYVVTTNEDGIGFDYGIERLDHLKLIKTFRYNIGDAQFFANVFKFER